MILRWGSPANNNPQKYRVIQETRAIRVSALAPNFWLNHTFPLKDNPTLYFFTLDCSLHLSARELFALLFCYTASHCYDLCIQVSQGSVNIALTHLTAPKRQLVGARRAVLHILSYGFSSIQPKGIKASFVYCCVSFKSSWKKKSHIFYQGGGMQAPGLCESIYSFFCFKWRGASLKQKVPVTSEWIWVVMEKSKRIELITMLCFFNAPVSHSSCLETTPSFPTWLRQRGVSIGSPFSPRLPGLHQCFFLSHLLFLSDVQPPSIHTSLFSSNLPVPVPFFPSPSVYLRHLQSWLPLGEALGLTGHRRYKSFSPGTRINA